MIGDRQSYRQSAIPLLRGLALRNPAPRLMPRAAVRRWCPETFYARIGAPIPSASHKYPIRRRTANCPMRSPSRDAFPRKTLFYTRQKILPNLSPQSAYRVPEFRSRRHRRREFPDWSVFPGSPSSAELECQYPAIHRVTFLPCFHPQIPATTGPRPKFAAPSRRARLFLPAQHVLHWPGSPFPASASARASVCRSPDWRSHTRTELKRDSTSPLIRRRRVGGCFI